MHRIIALVVLAVPVSFVAFEAEAQPAPSSAVVRVGAALSMTGPAAVYGTAQKNGIQAAVDDVNQRGSLRPLRLEAVFDDDGSRKEQGINVFQKFINQTKVSAIIGPTLSTTATAADPIAQQSKVPVLAISNTAPTGITDIGDYIWRDSLTEAQVIPGAIKKAHARLGFKTAGVLYGNDDVFTKAGYDVMKKALESEGVQILETQTFAKPDRDFNAQLTALKSKSPGILVISALADNAASIVTQARQLGYAGPVLGGNGFNSPAFIKNAGTAAEGVLVGTAWNSSGQDPANQAFLQSMRERGISPDQFTAQAYSGVLIIAEAIKKAGMKGGREDIKAGFAKVRDLPTPLGKFSFTPARDAQHEASVQQVKGGKFEILQ